MMSQQLDSLKSLHPSMEERTDNQGNIRGRRKRSTKGSNSVDINMDGIKISVKRRNKHVPNHKNPTREKRFVTDDACHLEESKVTFSDIGYDFIHRPISYKANKCVGRCTFPITRPSTKHAIIHAILHNLFPSSEEPPCCVPTKLNPISILYFNDNNVMEYIYEYQDMKATECGCR